MTRAQERAEGWVSVRCGRDYHDPMHNNQYPSFSARDLLSCYLDAYAQGQRDLVEAAEKNACIPEKKSATLVVLLASLKKLAGVNDDKD